MQHHGDDNADYCLSARDQFVALGCALWVPRCSVGSQSRVLPVAILVDSIAKRWVTSPQRTVAMGPSLVVTKREEDEEDERSEYWKSLFWNGAVWEIVVVSPTLGVVRTSRITNHKMLDRLKEVLGGESYIRGQFDDDLIFYVEPLGHFALLRSKSHLWNSKWGVGFICSDLTVWRIGSECKNNKTTVTLPAGKWVQWVALLDSPGNEDEAYVLTGPPPYTLLCVNLRCIEQNHEMQATNQWPCPFYVEPWVIKLDSGYILLGSVYGIVLLSENKVDSLFLNSSPEAPPLKVDDTHFLKPVGDGRTTMELHNANEESWKDQPERDKKMSVATRDISMTKCATMGWRTTILPDDHL
ncbi:hypothetical protein Pelo_5808 [Pelomyxa schiedti]|nr:hypothetical protein Pelo_5808 [Pelomyxa schiedti]